MPQQNKTTENTASVTSFIDAVADEARRTDSHQLSKLMQEQTGLEPRMWGTAIVGFGSYHYRYDSGREGDAPLVGFSPRSNALTLYIATNFDSREHLLLQLGKYKLSKACIYIKKLADVDIEVLKKLISDSVTYMRSKYYTD
jgi:hypothetical protein